MTQFKTREAPELHSFIDERTELKELEELLWIIPQFKDTHEKHYTLVAEECLVNSIIKKLESAKVKRVREGKE